MALILGIKHHRYCRHKDAADVGVGVDGRRHLYISPLSKTMDKHTVYGGWNVDSLDSDLWTGLCMSVGIRQNFGWVWVAPTVYTLTFYEHTAMARIFVATP